MVANYEELKVSKYAYKRTDIGIHFGSRPPSPGWDTPGMFALVQLASANTLIVIKKEFGLNSSETTKDQTLHLTHTCKAPLKFIVYLQYYKMFIYLKD